MLLRGTQTLASAVGIGVKVGVAVGRGGSTRLAHTRHSIPPSTAMALNDIVNLWLRDRLVNVPEIEFTILAALIGTVLSDAGRRRRSLAQ